MKDLWSTGKAAAYLGISKPTVVRAVNNGVLRPILTTPGGHRRFAKDDLDAMTDQIRSDLEMDGEIELPGETTPISAAQASRL